VEKRKRLSVLRRDGEKTPFMPVKMQFFWPVNLVRTQKGEKILKKIILRKTAK